MVPRQLQPLHRPGELSWEPVTCLAHRPCWLRKGIPAGRACGVFSGAAYQDVLGCAVCLLQPASQVLFEPHWTRLLLLTLVVMLGAKSLVNTWSERCRPAGGKTGGRAAC